jgi:hypothetical protein
VKNIGTTNYISWLKINRTLARIRDLINGTYFAKLIKGFHIVIGARSLCQTKHIVNITLESIR